MSQFMRDQSFPDVSGGGVLSRSKNNIVPYGESFCAEAGRSAGCTIIGVNSYLTEITSKT